jgi:serine/threonine protein kinase
MYYDSNQFFLVMERIPGESLDKVWPSLTESDKDGIIAKLHHVFDIMRQAKFPWPDTFFGSLDGGAVHHYLFWSMTGGYNLGPFNDEAAFVSGITTNYRLACNRKGWKDYKATFFETYLPRVLQGHRPTLTHGDVQPKNIMVAQDMNAKGERSFDVVLVDWESAGWYPGFWESFCAFSSPLFISRVWEDEWCLRVFQFLKVYPAEISMMGLLNRDWL